MGQIHANIYLDLATTVDPTLAFERMVREELFLDVSHNFLHMSASLGLRHLTMEGCRGLTDLSFIGEVAERRDLPE